MNDESWALIRKAEWWLEPAQQTADELFGTVNNRRMFQLAKEWGLYRNADGEVDCTNDDEIEAYFLLLIAEAIK